jgi:hypothetical protein
MIGCLPRKKSNLLGKLEDEIDRVFSSAVQLCGIRLNAHCKRFPTSRPTGTYRTQVKED